MNDTKHSSDTSSIESLDFKPTCEAKWADVRGRIVTCGGIAEYYGEYYAHSTHKYETRMFCKECLNKMLKRSRKIPWCIKCSTHKTIRSYRRI